MSALQIRRHSATLILGLSLLVVCATDARGEKGTTASRGGYLTVTYLGNEGVLISAPSGKVLIDALFGDGLTGYETVPRRERKKLENAAPPFDDVDLVLATHHHGDHFEAAAVSQHLQRNPRAIFVSTEQSVAAMNEFEEVPAESRLRIRAVSPAPGEEIEISLPVLRLRALNITHGTRSPPLDNLGFIVEIDGLKILHLGDSEATLEEFEAYDLAGERLDIAFVPFWYLLDEEGRTAVTMGLRARTVIPLHVPDAAAPASYFGGPGARDELLRSMENSVPGLTAFQQPLRTRRFAVPQATPSE